METNQSRLMLRIGIVLLSVGWVFSSIDTSVSAAPFPATPQIMETGLLQLAQTDQRRPRRSEANRQSRSNRPQAHRSGRHHAQRGGRPGHWNGHRGSRTYRRGWRRHNDGWWYPLAAFTAGAVVGGGDQSTR